MIIGCDNCGEKNEINPDELQGQNPVLKCGNCQAEYIVFGQYEPADESEENTPEKELPKSKFSSTESTDEEIVVFGQYEPVDESEEKAPEEETLETTFSPSQSSNTEYVDFSQSNPVEETEVEVRKEAAEPIEFVVEEERTATELERLEATTVARRLEVAIEAKKLEIEEEIKKLETSIEVKRVETKEETKRFEAEVAAKRLMKEKEEEIFDTGLQAKKHEVEEEIEKLETSIKERRVEVRAETEKLEIEIEAKRFEREQEKERLDADAEVRQTKVKQEAENLEAELKARRIEIEREMERLETEKEANKIQVQGEIERLETKKKAERLEADVETKKLETEKEKENLDAEVKAKKFEIEREIENLEASIKAKKVETEVETEKIEAEVEAKRLETEKEKERLDAEVEARRIKAEEETEKFEAVLEAKKHEFEKEINKLETEEVKEEVEEYTVIPEPVSKPVAKLKIAPKPKIQETLKPKHLKEFTIQTSPIPTILGPRANMLYVVGEEEFGDGDLIIASETFGDWFWTVLEGAVEVVRETKKGSQSILRLGQGTYPGVLAAIINPERHRSATVLSVGSTLLGVIDIQRVSAEFSVLSNEFKEFLRSLSQRLVDLTDLAEMYLLNEPPPPDEGIGEAKLVFGPDKRKEGLFRIEKGKAFLVRPIMGNKNIRLATLNPKDYFGSVPFLDFGHESGGAAVLGSPDLEFSEIDAFSLKGDFEKLSETARNIIISVEKSLDLTTRVAIEAWKKTGR